MPRPAKHSETQILGAAAALVAARGPSAATITAIGHAIGAPNGSIYHRFKTRDQLLGRLWLTKAAYFQDRWAEAVRHPDPREAGLAAALSLPRAVRDDLEGARIMLLHRREDFIGEGWPGEMEAEAVRLGQQMKDELAAITQRLFGQRTSVALQATTFAVLDLPYSAVRRYVASGEPPPVIVDGLIEAAYRGVIEQWVDEGG